MTDIDTRPPAVESPVVPEVTPQRIGPDTWLIPNLAPAGPGEFLFVNSLVILGDEPVVVDTGAPLHEERWYDALSSLVDPADVKWIFLSHDDGDHTGGLRAMLDAAPDATVVTNFFSFERLNLEPERALPLERMIWVEPGASLDERIYRRPVDLVEAFGATTIASAHGPVLSGQFIPDAFDRVRALAATPVLDQPDQSMLDELLAGVMAGPDSEVTG